MTTKTVSPPPPKFIVGHGNDLHLPAGRAVPHAVDEAARAVDERREALRALGAELHAAKLELRHAPTLDRADARAAAAAGEVVPEGALHELAARRAVDDLERRTLAAREVLDGNIIELSRRIVEHRASWVPAQEQAVEDLRETARGKLDELIGAIDALDVERGIADGLRSFPAGGSIVGAHFGRDSAASRAARRARAAAEVERTSAQGNMKTMVPGKVDHLLAALAREVG